MCGSLASGLIQHPLGELASWIQLRSVCIPNPLPLQCKLQVWYLLVYSPMMVRASNRNSLTSGHWRKRLLVVSAWIGSLSAILFLAPFQPSTPALLSSALLTAIGNTTYAISTVCNNAYLPLLAKASPEVQATLDEGLEEEVSLLPSFKRHNAALTLAISRISARGIALGFTSGVVLLTLLTIPVIVLNGSTASLRLAVGISGIWWAVFTFPAAWWLPSASRQSGIALIDIKVAWQRLGRMVRVAEMRRLKNTFTFLLAWIFLSDGE